MSQINRLHIFLVTLDNVTADKLCIGEDSAIAVVSLEYTAVCVGGD